MSYIFYGNGKYQVVHVSLCFDFTVAEIILKSAILQPQIEIIKRFQDGKWPV